MRDADGGLVALPAAGARVARRCLRCEPRSGARGRGTRFDANRIMLYVWPPSELPRDELDALVQRVAPLAAAPAWRRLVLRVQIARRTARCTTRSLRGRAGRATACTGASSEPPDRADRSRSTTTGRRCCAPPPARRYPYELVRMLLAGRAARFRPAFVEHDLDEHGALVPVDRPTGTNTAGVVAGVVTHRPSGTPRA